jgi:hypothetical protein
MYCNAAIAGLPIPNVRERASAAVVALAFGLLLVLVLISRHTGAG